MIKILTILLMASLLGMAIPSPAQTKIELKGGWKFCPGDDPAYARPDFDDAKWAPIRVDAIWEEQGYDKLDGYAWYRLRFLLPEAVRSGSPLKDDLRVCLGKINNFDQCYLNGQIFGVNGAAVPAATAPDSGYTKAEPELWDRERVYVLPANDPRISWGKENVIAVRVFDAGGQGGIWSGGQALRMTAYADFLACDASGHAFAFGARTGKSFTLKNGSSRYTLSGKLTIEATSKLDKRQIQKRSESVTLSPGAAKKFSYAFPSTGQAAVIRYEFGFSGSQEKWTLQEEAPYVLTPKPGRAPRLNGARIYGARPDKPFLYAVAASGTRPMTFSASGLPAGLAIDPATGIITGRVATPGEFKATLSAKNVAGSDSRELLIAIGDRIALTPPMGWNSWNCWGLSVDTDKVLASARVFKEKGLADHGWSFINIDDGWEIKGDSPAPKRSDRGDILTNEKFPDMKSLGDRIHSMGLKFGIYSSPGPLTCGGYTASYGYEANDARSYAAWGVDYLKYDWCSYEKYAKGDSRPELEKPYFVMRHYLDQQDRDIVYSLCQYGMGKVWEWGADVGGNLWRTTGDITDTWQSLRDIGFGQVENAPFAGPGRWNDPDMLVVGWVGWGPSLHPTKLTPDEQYTHISLWCLLSAPLLIGCDLERLDDFTLGLLTNDEVLALDQDPLGKQATPKIKTGNIQVWTKPLHDGRLAVGIFNLGEETEKFPLELKAIGLAGSFAIRDLWRQKELGVASDRFVAPVPAHGVLLVALKKTEVKK